MENYETPIPDFGVVGGASWTFNPSMQALNLTFLATTVSYELKKRSNYRCQNLNNRNLLFLVEITSGSPDLYCQLCRIFCKFFRNIVLAEHFIQKPGKSKYCNFLNSKLRHGYISALHKFYKIFRTQRGNQKHVKLDNIFWKLHVFEINIFSLSQFNFTFRKELEKENILSKSFISVTSGWDISMDPILQFDFKKLLDLDLKNLGLLF